MALYELSDEQVRDLKAALRMTVAKCDSDAVADFVYGDKLRKAVDAITAALSHPAHWTAALFPGAPGEVLAALAALCEAWWLGHSTIRMPAPTALQGWAEGSGSGGYRGTGWHWQFATNDGIPSFTDWDGLPGCRDHHDPAAICASMSAVTKRLTGGAE